MDDLPVLIELRKAADEAADIDDQIEAVEADLKELKRRRHELRSKTMPDMMDEVGLSEFASVDGVNAGIKFVMTRDVVGSFPRDEQRAAAAVKWLEDNGGDGIIKTKMSVHFPREAHQVAIDLAKRISNQCNPIVESTVHPQTLRKFARERFEAGEDVDLDTLGLTAIRYVRTKS